MKAMNTNEQKVALFDMDGVIVNTEPIYDRFWEEAGIRYRTGIDGFERIIKGTILADIIKKYFLHLSAGEIERLKSEVEAYEEDMPLPPVGGAMEFLHILKENGVRTGLVTSSGHGKVERVLREHGLEGVFDTVVSDKRIVRGKPDPMCYRLAATDLGVAAEECMVFEDSFNGIRAAVGAGMRVIGVSTTNSVEAIRGMVHDVIPDFGGITYARFVEWGR
jgi:HAD superfamily hydrolase (TIGR01509 family)